MINTVIVSDNEEQSDMVPGLSVRYGGGATFATVFSVSLRSFLASS